MIVVLGSTKGGVGKSTLAVQLALARLRAGRSVIVVDADRQKTATLALSGRREADRSPPLGCMFWPQPQDLMSGLHDLAVDHEDIIVDVGGHDSAALRAALLLADTLLVPVQPRSVDIWALTDLMLLVDRAQQVRKVGGHPALRLASLINMADPRGRDNEATRETIVETLGVTPFAAEIRRRKAFATATASGLAVAEQSPVDKLAVAEIEALEAETFAPVPSEVE